MKPSSTAQKTVTTDMPALPEVYAWQIIEAHHAGGTTFWLVITDSLWNEVARYGWRTGYVPTHQQLVNRAQTMVKEHLG